MSHFRVSDIIVTRRIVTPPSFPLPPPKSTAPLLSMLKKTRKAIGLVSLATRLVGAEGPMIHVDPVTGKANGPHIKKLRTYLGIAAQDKVDVTIDNWK